MIPTAEEFWNKQSPMMNIPNAMIEFAKLHVEGAKEQFKIVFSEIDDPYPFEYNDPLEDVYPLTNIK
jgi:hypothetical protein